jgi:DNA polymerase III subunit gamma/tau
MPLHLSQRPKDFDEIIGNDSMINSLSSIFERPESDWPHAFLFSGPYGCAKTTVARIISEKFFGKKLGDIDYHEVNCGNHGKIETIREIERASMYAPTSGKYTVWILDEFHMSGAGGASEKNVVQNAILKILEDTPKHVVIIICTTDPQRVLKTIHSRCTSFQVELLSDKMMIELLNRVLKNEGIDSFPKAAIDAIVEAADGHARDALKILDQVIDLDDESLISAIKKYSFVSAEAIELCRALIKKDSWDSVQELLKAIKKSDGNDVEKVRRMVLGYITTIMLNNKDESTCEQCMNIYDVFKSPTYDNGWSDIVFYSYQSVYFE